MGTLTYDTNSIPTLENSIIYNTQHLQVDSLPERQFHLCNKHYLAVFNQLHKPSLCASCSKTKAGTSFTRHLPHLLTYPR